MDNKMKRFLEEFDLWLHLWNKKQQKTKEQVNGTSEDNDSNDQ